MDCGQWVMGPWMQDVSKIESAGEMGMAIESDNQSMAKSAIEQPAY